MRQLLIVFLLVMTGSMALAEDNRIDHRLPDAPELAQPGPHAIGVRTLDLLYTDRPDVLTGPDSRYDRPLKVEVWYPAALGDTAPGGTYPDVQLANSTATVTLRGQAVRNAAPDPAGGPYPLVIISHGYPGNRYLLSPFGEHLASHGYVVASIDHFESTYENKLGFASTLANRSPDQLFVLDQMAALSEADDGFLAGLVDAEHSAIIGYSMGGYGAVISAGAGLSDAALTSGMAPAGALDALAAGSEAYQAAGDPRLTAAVAIAPWGAQLGMWDEAGLAGIEAPLLVIGGTQDEISDYANGIRRIFEGAINADRYMLSFQGAGHNAAAPMPPPTEALEQGGPGSPYEHYADFVWSNVRMNNVTQHVLTAFFGLTLKGDEGMARYLDLASGPWTEPAGDRDWPGFGPRTTRGLVVEHLPASR
ncbi:alpha/beta hydrolase family protein [Devosia salina]|uniref:Dienelactone hydrolase n=1 Tax=Devosia salina TaxID=2860336 RepID=A0ABX8W8U9_9HYPH|nr:dienelactone hydrolase [Devosia salina]QYO75389.1 dienelactone hydrolase [Devosia salina]